MDGQLFLRLYRRLVEFASSSRRAYEQYSDTTIAAVYLWAVLHDRPQGWGCNPENWDIEPLWPELPSQSCLSRRLKEKSVKELLDRLCGFLWGRFRARMFKLVDGKALTVSMSSKDKTATIGPASGGRLAKGYKLHVIVDGAGVLISWAIAPLNHDETTVARKLIQRLSDEGYLVGDVKYDNNRLYCHAAGYGHQLVAHKRGGHGLGHRRHSPHRLRGLELLKQPLGKGLLKLRKSTIERFYGNLGWCAGGLSQLPGFVRTMHRVRLWVQGKLIFQALRRDKKLELR